MRDFAGDTLLASLIAGVVLLAPACAHKVKIEAPEEPIVINLNVKIEHELRVKVDKELDDLFDDREDLFGGSE